MAAIPKLSKEQWEAARSRWEADPREGFSWLVADLNLPISAPGVRKTAVRDGWAKGAPAQAGKGVQGEKKKPKVSPAKVSRNRDKVSLLKVSQPGETRAVAERRPRGRPTLYREEYAEQATKLCLLGATDADLANFFDVAVSTVALWKVEHPNFSDALKAGKDKADANVARSLYQRATGYSHPDVHVSNYKGEITITPLIKHHAPDPTSMIFWLKNRQPKKWRDRIEVESDVSISVLNVAKLNELFISRMEKARERQASVLIERGIVIEG